MKKLILTIVAIISISIFAKSQEIKNLDKIMNDDKITTVFISKAMFEMVPEESFNQMSSEMNNVDISKIAHAIEGIYIFTSKEKNAISKLKNSFDPTSNNNNEILMFIKDEGSLVKLTGEKTNAGYKNLFMTVDDIDSSYVVIYLKGLFDKEDVKKLIDK